MKKRLLIMSVVLVCTVMKAQAASFDCVKSNTDIEKMICADAELSKLDEQLASAYKYAFKITTDKNKLKKDQNKWLKKDRNACANQVCLKASYQSRIEVLKELRLEEFNKEVVRASVKLEKISAEKRVDSAEEIEGEIPYLGAHGNYPSIPASYRLAMSKNDKLCHHVAQSLPQIKYNGVCDYCLDGVDLFKGVKWIKTTDMKTQQTGERYHTVIDINNDEKLDSVSYMQTMKQSIYYHFLWVNLGRPSNKGLEGVEVSDYYKYGKDLGRDSIGFPLTGFSEKPNPDTRDYQFDYEHFYIDPKNQVPFLFEGKTYIFMDSSAYIEQEPMKKKWIVINQYLGGEFLGRDKHRIFDDQCYFEVIFDKANK